MTKPECIELLKANLPEFMGLVEEEFNRLMNSGGIDLEPYEKDSYVPVRIILPVALRNVAIRISTVAPEHRRLMKNLEHF